MYGFSPSSPQWEEKQPRSDASACSWAAAFSPSATGMSPTAARSALMSCSINRFNPTWRSAGKSRG